MIQTFFPVGTGFGSFESAYRGFEPFQNLAPMYMNQAHNDWLQIILEGGLAGLFLLAVFVGWWGRTAIRVWRNGGGERDFRLARLGSVLLLLVMIASITDYPARTPLIMVIVVQSAIWMLAPTAVRTGLLDRQSGSAAIV
jgi:O-antigen ligase